VHFADATAHPVGQVAVQVDDLLLLVRIGQRAAEADRLKRWLGATANLTYAGRFERGLPILCVSGPRFLDFAFRPFLASESFAFVQSVELIDAGGPRMEHMAALSEFRFVPGLGVDPFNALGTHYLLEPRDAADLSPDPEPLAERPELPVVGHLTAYDKAVRLMRSDAAKAFDVGQEPDELRQKYGRNQFGQGCLLARRLVESGVRLVSVIWMYFMPNGRIANVWDTHGGIIGTVVPRPKLLPVGWTSPRAAARSQENRGL
jgi:hypothetical protein